MVVDRDYIIRGMETLRVRNEELEKTLRELTTEQLRMQGEYRLLAAMGKEMGVVDEHGNIVEDDKKEGKVVEVPK